MKSVSKFASIVLIILIISSCFNEEEFDSVNPSDFLTIEDHERTAKADGADVVTVTISLDPKIERSKRIVTLKTTLGNFLSGKGDSIVLRGGKESTLKAFLVSSKIGEASLSAKIDAFEVKAENQISFTKVFPVQILAKVDSFAIRSDFKNEITVTASMKSENGIPSQGQTVVFSGFTLEGTPIGTFLNGVNSSSSDGNGNATIRYAIGPTSYRGQINLFVETQKEDGSIIRGSTKINLID